MGIQTGSEEINKNIYNRFVTNKQVITTTKIINKYKMLTPEYQFIITNPYETEKDVLDTLDLLEKIPKPYYFISMSLVFFPGTQIFHRAKSDGIIRSKEDSCFNIEYMEYRKHIKLKKLDELYLNMILALISTKIVTSWRYGLFPRPIFKLLLNKTVVRFFNKFIKLMLRYNLIL